MDKNLLAVMGLALALPTSILAVAAVVYQLIEKEIIGNMAGLGIILAVIFNIFFLMFKHLRKNREKSDE
ncbi:MAG: hypothetical protein CME64_14825 [Halobacteriovoraceae bacterium]|nr:hypothetical protein [Halobacteriovoraceae bacterium]|tara:strand:+ start:13615 stop:13821 length:207 start_codon:yes stop_codon:yes gene_type:complete